MHVEMRNKQNKLIDHFHLGPRSRNIFNGTGEAQGIFGIN